VTQQQATPPIALGVGNEEQYAAWNGEEGDLWVRDADFYDGAVRVLHRRLLSAAEIQPGDRVLDVGCGTGQCTRDAARLAGPGAATGIDLSLPMIQLAERTARREGLSNATFVQGDAQVFAFPDAVFDVALSRTGAMFFADQVAAFSNIARALRPGGRLLLVSWRSARENEWISLLREALLPGAPPPEPAGDLPTPFRHADRQGTTAVLERAGFEDVGFEALDSPMYLGADAADAFPKLRDLFGWMVRDLPAPELERALARMLDVLCAHETPDGVAFGSASWLVTAHRPHGSGGGPGPNTGQETGAPA
jgi:SAM-dependent methyltransferase